MSKSQAASRGNVQGTIGTGKENCTSLAVGDSFCEDAAGDSFCEDVADDSFWEDAAGDSFCEDAADDSFCEEPADCSGSFGVCGGGTESVACADCCAAGGAVSSMGPREDASFLAGAGLFRLGGLSFFGVVNFS